MHSRRDTAQSVGSVVRRVETGDHREEDLRRADVARGLSAADVLLASAAVQGAPGPTGRVDRHTSKAARQRTLLLVASAAKPACGPPNIRERDAPNSLRRVQRRCPHPESPGATQRAPARTRMSYVTVTSAPLRVHRIDRIRVVSRPRPLLPGYCTKTPKDVRRGPARQSSGSPKPSTSSPKSGSARVRDHSDRSAGDNRRR